VLAQPPFSTPLRVNQKLCPVEGSSSEDALVAELGARESSHGEHKVTTVMDS
jgi:hypothetical protein